VSDFNVKASNLLLIADDLTDDFIADILREGAGEIKKLQHNFNNMVKRNAALRDRPDIPSKRVKAVEVLVLDNLKLSNTVKQKVAIIDSLYDALYQLIVLKRHKEVFGKTNEYLKNRAIAWEIAGKALENKSSENY